LPIAVGLLVLFVPTYIDLSHTLWNTEEYAHGPMLAAVILWLMWRERQALLDDRDSQKWVFGALLVAIGAAMYSVGRSQDILQFEVGAQVPILAGVLLATKGPRTLRRYAFPLFMLVFLVPLPGILVDWLTAPLKQYISEIAEFGLYNAGYPVARNGVMLAIGQYQVLVADACSGLHSLFTLSAIGMLYVYLMGYRNWWHNGILVASILPIAFFANVVRVIILVLVTFHFGDSAGQGFIHSIAGWVMFVVALASLFMFDNLARWLIRDRMKRPL